MIRPACLLLYPLLLCTLLCGCIDKKADLLQQHADIYSVVVNADYPDLPALLTDESQDFLQELSTANTEDARSALATKYRIPHFIRTYYASYKSPSYGSITDIIRYLGHRGVSLFSLTDVFYPIVEETKAAPEPFVAIYRVDGDHKKLQWLKYGEVGGRFLLDLLFVLRQEEKKLRQEVQLAVKGYKDLDVDAFLLQYYEELTVDAALVQQERELLAARKSAYSQ